MKFINYLLEHEGVATAFGLALTVLIAFIISELMG